jgi:hypothetical protein
MSSSVRINIENFRAINKASIIIDGITLVAGENGCGKSTLSKLLYFLYKTASNYENIVEEQLLDRLQNFRLYINILLQESKLQPRDKREVREEVRKIITTSSKEEDWIELINKIEYLLNKQQIDISKINRIRWISKDLLNESFSDENQINFGKIKEFIINQFKEAEGKKSSRPISLFTNELKKVFVDSKLPTTFEVFEYGDEIVSLKQSNLSIPYNIQNAIYIDTPMMLSVESENTHWDDLNNLLQNSRKDNGYKEIKNIDINDIIQGDVYWDDDLFDEGLKYKRLDGKIFDLSEVATGIKAFSILQLLLKGGNLTSNTLLIIDEPESNLHPQWIVEYARMIVMLNKELGVKFFLASHNPDMVSAIRYISEKEGILDNVNFYIAEKEEKTFSYDYKYLMKDIEPIFESFNIAIDRINKYGGGDEV